MVRCEERQAPGEVAAPVTCFKGSPCILSHLLPSLIVEGGRAGSSPLIRSKVVIIGPLRSQKDTQHVAEKEPNSEKELLTSTTASNFFAWPQ